MELREFELVDQALSEGRIGFDHARAIVEAANPRISEEIRALQGPLIDRAGRCPFANWRRDLGVLVGLLDADGGFDPDRHLARNKAMITPLGAGDIRIEIELTGEFALIGGQCLEAETDRMFHQYRTDHDLHPELAMPHRRTLRALAAVELFRRGTATDLAASKAPHCDLSFRDQRRARDR